MTKADFKIIGENVRFLMDVKGITQAELAKAIGVSESAVGKWVLGHNFTSMGNAQKLADYFGVTLSDLVSDMTRKNKNRDILYLTRQMENATDEEVNELKMYWENIIKQRGRAGSARNDAD